MTKEPSASIVLEPLWEAHKADIRILILDTRKLRLRWI